MTTTLSITADELLRLRDGKHHELIDGKLVPVPSGAELSQIVVSILCLVGPFVRERELGRLVGSTAGFQCFPQDSNRVRRPHLAYVSYERLSRHTRVPGHCPVAPEIAVLVVAESDLWRDITCKVQDYLAANVLRVWVVDEFVREVFVFSASGCQRLTIDDQLSGEDILPGFGCPVSEIFAGIPTDD